MPAPTGLWTACQMLTLEVTSIATAEYCNRSSCILQLLGRIVDAIRSC